MTKQGRRIGIKDVAAATGLSITTVSFALNGTGQVSAANRQKVLRIARELGYQPNAAARSLKSGRSRILGVAVAHRDSQPWQRTYMPYYRSVIAGAAIAAVEHGHAVAAIPVGADGAIDLSVPVDGLIVVDPGRRDPLLAACVERDIPVVVDGRPLDRRFADLPVVQSDMHSGMAAVLQHFADQQVRRATLLTGPQTDSYTLDTEHAFASGARLHGIEARLRRIGRRDSALTAAREVLNSEQHPDAVHCLNETYGHALLAAAAEAKLVVPDDLLVTMMGESASAGSGNGVSYLVLDPAEVGAHCVQLLIDLLEGKQVDNVMLPTDFVVTSRAPAR
ncbi:MAG: LacI family DNA-binding transcriptional regulator [Mycobacteriaceae bacterium]